MLRLFALVGVLLLVALRLPAADVDGTWTGSFEFSGQSVPVTLQLKGAEGVVTGTVQGLPTSDPEIKDGKLDGDNISFSVNVEYQGPVKLLWKGKVSGDEIQLDLRTGDGTWGTQFTVKKS